MDPALAAFDIAKAGAILADMVISYLAPGASPSDPEEEPDDHEDRRSAPVAAGLHLHPSVDAGAGPVQSGEHGPTIHLMNKARSLGWSEQQIRVLDRDLGQSGAAANTRADFKSLVGDVAMGHVGAIFSLEASRLARSNHDWHRLLELCAITDTLVIDEDGCYNPADFNDGLVLGMKGTFAQAELHIIRARLHGGKINKASRGDLRFPLPVGLVFEDEKIVLDPDREVQGAVRTVFELFEREGTAYGVVRRYQELGLRFPRRSYGGAWNGKLLWGRLTHSRVRGILTTPPMPALMSSAATNPPSRWDHPARSPLARVRCPRTHGE